jgi:tRNA modification GTPase
MNVSGPAESTDQEESVAALLTPPGRGAVAVVAAQGPAARRTIDQCFHAVSGRPASGLGSARIALGVWRDGDQTDGPAGEELIVSTAVDGSLEIHCHGGRAAAERVLAALAQRGCRIVAWQEWLTLCELSPDRVTAASLLAECRTLRTARIVLDQYHGAFERAIQSAVDRAASGDATGAVQLLQRILCWAPLGLRLIEPWVVAVAGLPNVGKSALVNAILGYERAIVFDQPGTTRDLLAAETAIEGWPVRLIDSAGLRTTDHELELAGVELARWQHRRADAVLWVLDASTLAEATPAEALAAARRQIDGELGAGIPEERILIVANKIDLLGEAAAQASEAPPEDRCEHGVVAWISATRGDGIADLLAIVSRRLVPDAPTPGEAAPLSAEQVERVEQLIEQFSNR